MERISSRKNPLCLRLRRLAADGKYRRETGCFLCDSPKLTAEALRWAADTVELVAAAPGLLPPGLPPGVRAVELTEDVMESVAPSKTPQGVLAVCRMRPAALPERLEGKRYVVLDGVQDPGNVGTILRTADAFWADGLFLVNGCADLYHPRTLRAGMGASFRCPVWTCGAEELAALLRRSGIPLYGAALRADTRDAREMDYTRATVAIGSEGRGLSQQVLSLCDATVKIPMNDRCESLNAAAAAAALLWEMARG